MPEFVISDRSGRPMAVVEAPNIGSINSAIMRLPSGQGFDGTIRLLSEVETEFAGADTRRRERLSTTLQRLGMSGDGLAGRNLAESRASHLRRLPHYKIPAGGIPAGSGSGATPSAAEVGELRERAVKAFDRLGVSEAVALRGL